MNTGDTIRIFPETCISAYVQFIHSQGFRCKNYGDYLLVTEPLKKPIDRRATARTITQIRRKNNLSRKDMADKLNIHEYTIWKWEVGRNLPDKTNQQQLKELLGWEGLVYKK